MPSSKAAPGDNGLPQRLGLGVYHIFSLSVFLLHTFFSPCLGSCFAAQIQKINSNISNQHFINTVLKKIGKFALAIIFSLGDYLESITQVAEDDLCYAGNSQKLFEGKKEEFTIKFAYKTKTQYFSNKGQLELTSGKHSFICYHVHYIRPIQVLESQRFPLCV